MTEKETEVAEEAPGETQQQTYRIEQRPGRTHWQVFDPNGDLVCLTVYKRGAEEVVRRLMAAGRSAPCSAAAAHTRGCRQAHLRRMVR